MVRYFLSILLSLLSPSTTRIIIIMKKKIVSNCRGRMDTQWTYLEGCLRRKDRHCCCFLRGPSLPLIYFNLSERMTKKRKKILRLIFARTFKKPQTFIFDQVFQFFRDRFSSSFVKLFIKIRKKNCLKLFINNKNFFLFSFYYLNIFFL